MPICTGRRRPLRVRMEAQHRSQLAPASADGHHGGIDSDWPSHGSGVMFSRLAVMIVQLCNIFADRRDLLLENAALRQQLAIYQRKVNRPLLTSTDRRFWVWLSRAWPRWRSGLYVVQPETVIRWHRDASQRYWTWRSRRHSRGRPR